MDATREENERKAREEQRRWEEEELKRPRVGLSRFGDDPDYAELLEAHEGSPRRHSPWLWNPPAPGEAPPAPSAPSAPAALPPKARRRSSAELPPNPPDPSHVPEPDDADWVREQAPDLVDGLLPHASLVLLAAPAKAGKTDLATALAYAVASGAPFAGRRVRQGPVLWLAYEETMYERAHLDRGRPNGPDGGPAPFRVVYRPEPLDAPPGPPRPDFALRRLVPAPAPGAWLEALVARHRPRLVVVDPLHAAAPHTALSHARPARALMTDLRRLAYEANVTLLVLHHLNKTALPLSPGPAAIAGAIADSPQILASAGGHLLLQSAPGRDEAGLPGRRVRLHVAGRGVGVQTEDWFSRGPLDYRPAPGPNVTPTAARILALLEAEPDLRPLEIADRLGKSPGTIRLVLLGLVREGHVLREPVRQDLSRYRLREE